MRQANMLWGNARQISEAPDDGKIYVRRSRRWVALDDLYFLDGRTFGTSTVNGRLQIQGRMTGSTNGESIVSGFITHPNFLAGTTEGASAVNGHLWSPTPEAPKPITGATAGSSEVRGRINIKVIPNQIYGTDADGNLGYHPPEDIIPGGGNDVVAGDGMDFVTNDPVTLGTPSTIDSTTTNAVTATSHTHALGKVALEDVITGEPVEYGGLYNWWAATDTRKITSSDDWIIPTNTNFETLRAYIAAQANNYDGTTTLGTNSSNKQAMAVASVYEDWIATAVVGSPGNNSVNDKRNITNFNARPAGVRDGAFGGILSDFAAFSSVESGDYAYTMSLGNNYTSLLILNGYTKNYGLSLRFLYAGAGAPTSYTGNNGKTYPVVQIGTQYWVAVNINETKYRNGEWIHGFDGGVYTPIADATWQALTTEGMCYYGDNEGNGGGETPLENLLIDEKVKYDGADPTPGYLSEKIAAGAGVTITKGTGANENKVLVEIAAAILQDWQGWTFEDITPGTAKTYVIHLKAKNAYTINSIVLQTDNGTLTGCALKINGTAITGLNNLTITTTIAETSATGANVVASGDIVTFEITTGYTGSPTLIHGVINYTKN